MSKIIETENPVKVVTDGNQLNPMNEVFIWTDELVMEFVKVATMGSYGDYTGLKKLDDKLERFKELKILS